MYANIIALPASNMMSHSPWNLHALFIALLWRLLNAGFIVVFSFWFLANTYKFHA